MQLENQYDTGDSAVVFDVLPLMKSKKNEILQMYGNKDAAIRYSARDPDATDARTVLSNALMSAAANDIERQKLSDYQEKIAKMDEEQAKLSELRSRIKEMSFSKGTRDMAKLRELRDEATKTANRINIYDKQLLRLEVSAPLANVLKTETERVAGRTAAKVREAERAKAQAKYARYEAEIQHRKDMRQKGIDQRKSKDLRAKIKAIRQDFQKRLMNGNERTHIPVEFAQEIIDICIAIDPTGEDQNTKAAQKYRDGKDALLRLRSAYDSVETGENSGFSDQFRADFSKAINDLATALDGVPLREMNREQLKAVYDVMSQIRHIIINANKLLGTERAESVEEAKQNIRDNMDEVKKLGLVRGGLLNWELRWFTNPLRIVREMTGYDENSALRRLFEDINEGRKKGAFWAMQARKVFEDLTTGKENQKKYRDAAQKA